MIVEDFNELFEEKSVGKHVNIKILMVYEKGEIHQTVHTDIIYFVSR